MLVQSVARAGLGWAGLGWAGLGLAGLGWDPQHEAAREKKQLYFYWSWTQIISSVDCSDCWDDAIRVG